MRVTILERRLYFDVVVKAAIRALGDKEVLRIEQLKQIGDARERIAIAGWHHGEIAEGLTQHDPVAHPLMHGTAFIEQLDVFRKVAIVTDAVQECFGFET